MAGGVRVRARVGVLACGARGWGYSGLERAESWQEPGGREPCLLGRRSGAKLEGRRCELPPRESLDSADGLAGGPAAPREGDFSPRGAFLPLKNWPCRRDRALASLAFARSPRRQSKPRRPGERAGGANERGRPPKISKGVTFEKNFARKKVAPFGLQARFFASKRGVSRGRNLRGGLTGGLPAGDFKARSGLAGGPSSKNFLCEEASNCKTVKNWTNLIKASGAKSGGTLATEPSRLRKWGRTSSGASN